MNITNRKSNRKVKCRECGIFVKEAINICFNDYSPHKYLFGGGCPLYLCTKCLDTLRSKIDALTLLVSLGVNTRKG